MISALYFGHFIPDTLRSVNIETRLQAERPGFNSWQGQWWNFFSLLPRPDRLWNPPSLLYNGCRRLLPRG